MILKPIQHVRLNIYIYKKNDKIKNETDACMFLLTLTPCWPASAVFRSEQASSDSMCGVPRKLRGV